MPFNFFIKIFSPQIRLEGISANMAGQFAVVLEVSPRFGYCITVSIPTPCPPFLVVMP